MPRFGFKPRTNALVWVLACMLLAAGCDNPESRVATTQAFAGTAVTVWPRVLGGGGRRPVQRPAAPGAEPVTGAGRAPAAGAGRGQRPAAPGAEAGVLRVVGPAGPTGAPHGDEGYARERTGAPGALTAS